MFFAFIYLLTYFKTMHYGTSVWYVCYGVREQVPSTTRPLIILLDGLDQLGTAHRAHSLAWLPTTLPPHVRLLLSTLQQPDKYDLLHTLKALLSPRYTF